MVDLDFWFFAVAIPAVLFAGVSKAGFGSGASFAAGAILAMFVSPGMALGIMLPLYIMMDATAIRPYWGKWHGPSAKWLVIGSVPGIAIAGLIYASVDANVFRFLIGVICLAFVAYQAARAYGVLRVGHFGFNRNAGALAGLVAGFTSFVAHAGGPPAAVFLLGQGLSKTTYQATTVVVFSAINLLKFFPFLALGIFTWQTALIDLLLAPFAFIGAWLGVRAHQWVPEKAFFALTYVLLVLTGLRLIWLSVG